jgi:Protein of unknown function (DUF3011)
MRARVKALLLFEFAFAMLGLPGTARAQSTIICASNDGGRHYCGRYDRSDVRLSRQLSGARCDPGRGWGVDRRGRLWVDHGCRAEFTIRSHDYGNRGGYNEGWRGEQTIICSSDDGGRHYCGQNDWSDVRLSRQLSGARCDAGSGWGVDQRGLWVDHGCRAEFTVRSRDYGNRGGYNEGWRGERTITCSSDDGGRHYCGQYDWDDVRLSRQLSGSPCDRGSGWGVDRRGLWVDHGCRAEFTIRNH